MNDTTQSPLVKWAEWLAYVRKCIQAGKDDTLSPIDYAFVDVADYAEQLEAELAAQRAGTWQPVSDATVEIQHDCVIDFYNNSFTMSSDDSDATVFTFPPGRRLCQFVPAPEPEPITPEALEAAGWERSEDDGESPVWQLAGREPLYTVKVSLEYQYVRFSSIRVYGTVDHIRTMPDLLALVRLLTGKEATGE